MMVTHQMNFALVMSSSHVRVRLEQPISDVRDFHSTNGHALFSDEGEMLLISDARMLILLNYESGAALHCYPPMGRYFRRPSIVGDLISAGLYSANGDSASFGPIAVSDPQWKAGLGRAGKGLLPSVHMPYYNATFK